MTETLKMTTEFFAETLVGAEGIVTDMKEAHSSSIINHSITRKEKKGFEYFIVKVTVQFATAKEILEDVIDE